MPDSSYDLEVVCGCSEAGMVHDLGPKLQVGSFGNPIHSGVLVEGEVKGDASRTWELISSCVPHSVDGVRQCEAVEELMLTGFFG